MGGFIDLTGEKFGRLTVINESDKRDKSGNVYWNCKCDCGKMVSVQGRFLRSGHTKSCGCHKKESWNDYISKTFKDMTGERYGNLTVVERGEDYIDKNNHHTTTWICRCDCGETTKTTRTMLISGRIKSCGCKSPRFEKTHGGSRTRLYRIFQSIKARCYYTKHQQYHNYGGRGIKICDEWLNDFNKFRDWAMDNGYSEELTIDRIDVNGDYEPDNCRWATHKQQSNNRRDNHIIEFNGESHTVTEWADITGINEATMFNRIKAGWSIEDVITKPVRRKTIQTM